MLLRQAALPKARVQPKGRRWDPPSRHASPGQLSRADRIARVPDFSAGGPAMTQESAGTEISDGEHAQDSGRSAQGDPDAQRTLEHREAAQQQATHNSARDARVNRGSDQRGSSPGVRAQPTEIVYCAGGARSALAVETLRQLGYSSVAHLEGGFTAWTRAGQAVTRL
jgi:rhodanese-related sulfurtransferase